MFSGPVAVAHPVVPTAGPDQDFRAHFSLSPAALGSQLPPSTSCFFQPGSHQSSAAPRSAPRINEMGFSCAASGRILTLNLCGKQRWFADSWVTPPVWGGFPSMPRILPGFSSCHQPYWGASSLPSSLQKHWLKTTCSCLTSSETTGGVWFSCGFINSSHCKRCLVQWESP